MAEMEKKISMQACNVLNDLRMQGQLCDVTIKVGEREFPAHKAILSSCSPYFRALFTNGMNESVQRTVEITDIDGDLMAGLIDYAYTREIVIEEGNVERMLPTADQFGVLGVVGRCVDFLASKICHDNCIGMWLYARSYFCEKLIRATHGYILGNFHEVSQQSDEFLDLGFDDLMTVLKEDELNAKYEEKVFNAIVRWIEHDEPNRRYRMEVLLPTVRLGFVHNDFFMNKIKTHPYVKDNEACKPLVIETMKFLYDLNTNESVGTDFNNPMCRPRIPRDILLAIGGWSGGSPTNVIEAYDTRADRWMMIPSVDAAPRAYHGVAILNGLVYVVGGFDGTDYFNSVRCFNPMNMTWKEVAPMNSRRCYVSVAVMGGCIYAMGGFDGHTRQRTAERYQPESNQWTLIEPMNHQRSDAAAISLNDKIYMFGGFNGHECLMSSEFFDPDQNAWIPLPPMRSRRSGVSATAYKGTLYVIGGFNGITRLSSGERFDFTSNTWSAIPNMYTPRSNFGIGVIDDMIFVIGGFNGVTTIFNVECYDDDTNEWYDAADMNLFRSALSVGVISDLPNRRTYTFDRERPPAH